MTSETVTRHPLLYVPIVSDPYPLLYYSVCKLHCVFLELRFADTKTFTVEKGTKMMEVNVHPFTAFVAVLIVGYVVARVVISDRQLRSKPKHFVMIVRHHGQDFKSFTKARNRREAENELHKDICQQIREAGLNPFDGATEYRLFNEALPKPLTEQTRKYEKLLVFKPDKR
jgi:hypothetical protein